MSSDDNFIALVTEWGARWKGVRMDAGCQTEPVVIGIDEAGRGCVLGPLVYGVACWPLSFDEQANKMGFKDSKKLTEIKRKSLLRDMTETDRISFGTLSLGADAISRLMKDGVNLNQISHAMILSICERARSTFVLDSILCDTVGPQAKLGALITKHNGRVPCCVVERADDRFVHVSAASIVAKVTRDTFIEDFARVCGELDMQPPGSGYSSDPTTIAFLQHIAQLKKKSSESGNLEDWNVDASSFCLHFVRTTWSTCERLGLE